MTQINNYKTWIALMQLVNVQQNGQIPPSVFNTWYNEVNSWYFNHLAERYQLSQIISDYLAPFTKRCNIVGVPQTGQNWVLFKKPSDFEFFLNAAILRQKEERTCFFNKDLPLIDGNGNSTAYTDPDIAAMQIAFAGANVEEKIINMVDTSRWPACLNHLTKGPTWSDPKMTQYDKGYIVSPKGIPSIVVTYLKTPTQSVFAYTINASDIAQYDPSGSTQLDWSDQVTPIFLAKLVTKYGLYINDPSIVKMGDEMLMLALKDQE
jgi:hypothetical protein